MPSLPAAKDKLPPQAPESAACQRVETVLCFLENARAAFLLPQEFDYDPAELSECSHEAEEPFTRITPSVWHLTGRHNIPQAGVLNVLEKRPVTSLLPGPLTMVTVLAVPQVRPSETFLFHPSYFCHLNSDSVCPAEWKGSWRIIETQTQRGPAIAVERWTIESSQARPKLRDATWVMKLETT